MTPTLPPASQVTVVSAIRRRLPLTIAIVILVAGLGWIVGQRTGGSWIAIATLIVEDPRSSGTEAGSQGSSDRYVNEQLAIFRLDQVAQATAELTETRIRRDVLRSSRLEAVAGADGSVRIGLDGTVVLRSGAFLISLEQDGSVIVDASPIVTAAGDLLDGAGRPVLDEFGRQIFVGPSDQVVVRSDRTMLVVDSLGLSTVVDPSAQTYGSQSLRRHAEIGANDVSRPEERDGEVEALPPLPSDVVAKIDGGVSFKSGPLTIESTPGFPALLIGSDGEPLVRPDTDQPLGALARIIMIDESGNAIVPTADQLILVEEGSGVTVLDGDTRVVASSEPSTLVLPDEERRPVLPEIAVEEVEAGLVVGSPGNSDLIEARFTSASSDVAIAGVNAAVEAYQSLRDDEVQTSNGAALRRADSAIDALTEELSEVEGELTAARFSSESREVLGNQYDQILGELAIAGQRLIDSSDPSAARRVQDLLLQLQAIETIERTESAQPVLGELLLRRQNFIDRLDGLEAQRDSFVFAVTGSGSNITLLSPAIDAEPVTGLGGPRLALAGAIIGLALGAAVAYVLDLNRPERLVDSADVEAVLGMPLIAEIPDYRFEGISGGLPVVDRPSTLAAEAYRFGSAAISISGDRSVIGVVSATSGEGNTSFATNAATALAQSFDNVVAVDADLEAQEMSRLLRPYLASNNGLTPPDLAEMLDDGESVAMTKLQRIDLPTGGTFRILGGGTDPQVARKMFGSVQASEMFDRLREHFAFVIVDVPPCLSVAYTATLLPEFDEIIVVVKAGTTIRELRALVTKLRFSEATRLGFVYSHAPMRPGRPASAVSGGDHKFAQSNGKRSWSKRLRVTKS